jgi:hypothetical protein
MIVARTPADVSKTDLQEMDALLRYEQMVQAELASPARSALADRRARAACDDPAGDQNRLPLLVAKENH